MRPLDFASFTQIFGVFIPVHLSHPSPRCLAGGHNPYVSAHVNSQFPCCLCTRSLSFSHLSLCSIVPFPACVGFCHSAKRSSCIFSWISGMRSSKKFLGGEPSKNSIRFHWLKRVWHGKRFWAKMSERNENCSFKMDTKRDSQRKKRIFLLHCVKGLYAEGITSWMHIRSCQRSLSSINLILEPMITSVDYLNKAMVGKQERRIKEKRFCCEHSYHRHPSDAVI